MKMSYKLLCVIFLFSITTNLFAQEESLSAKTKRLNSPSYKAVMELHKKYKLSNKGNCLTREKGTETVSEWSGIGPLGDTYRNRQVPYDLLVNNCSRPFILLGIKTDKNPKTGEFVYSDASITIEPGEKFNFKFRITNPEYVVQDDYYPNEQNILDLFDLNKSTSSNQQKESVQNSFKKENESKSVKLKEAIVLRLPEEGNSGASVIWNPIQKKYYAAYAGNSDFTMGVFDASGKSLKDNIKTDFDLRGIWYNSITKRIEFNCYDNAGIGHFDTDASGLVLKKVIDLEGMNQPDAQSVGVYVSNNTIAYLTPTFYIEKYNAKTGLSSGSQIKIHVGCKTNEEVIKMESENMESTRWKSRNTSVALYTGIERAEWAILNVDDRIIELYDEKTGLLSKTYKNIPQDIPLYRIFNFSYANGIWWFFHKNEKKWVGWSTSN